MNSQRALVKQDSKLLLFYEFKHKNEVLEGNIDGAAEPYQMGVGQWPIAIELSMLNQQVGSKITLKLSKSDDAFGKVDLTRVMSVEKTDFDNQPNIGALMEFKLPDGHSVEGQVLSECDGKFEVDFNHPYAGRDLEIYIQIHKIV